MPANIISPLSGDRPSIPVGGSITIYVAYNFAAATTFKGHVDSDVGGAVTVSGSGTTSTSVACTKGAGMYPNVPVHIKDASGSPTFDTETLTTLRVFGSPPPPPVPPTPVAQRAAPAAPAPKPAAGTGPISYILRDNFAAGVAYIVCVAHEMTADPTDPRVPVDGVLIRNGGATAWAGLVTVPNQPDKVYVARLIEFDATDTELGRQTVVLD